MTPYTNDSDVFIIYSGGIPNTSITADQEGVRPVINLLKTAIPAQS